MTNAARRALPVRRQLEAYEESWKRDHDAVKDCWALESTIAAGIATCSLLERVEHAWRDRVFRGAVEAGAEANDLFRSLFELWLRVTESVLGDTARLERDYGSVEGAAELRQAEERLRKYLDSWQPPRLSSAVALREVTLSPEAAAELDRLLSEPPPVTEPPRPPMQELSLDEFKQPRSR
jgi:hypothetical protein